MIRVSIVTINFNNCAGLEKTLRSIESQTYVNYQLIIIDGKSTDRFEDVIEQYRSIIHVLVSEPDSGIYDAMNKGLSYCSGDFVLFLNSGDCLHDENSLRDVIESVTHPDFIYFGKAVIKSDTAIWIWPPEGVIMEKWLRSHSPNHQAIFFPKCVYTQIRYDNRFKISGDTDYIRKAMIKAKGVKMTTAIVSVFQLGGISSNPKSFRHVLQHIGELIKIRNRYYPNKLIRNIDIIFRYMIKYISSRLLRGRYFGFIKRIKRYK